MILGVQRYTTHVHQTTIATSSITSLQPCSVLLSALDIGTSNNIQRNYTYHRYHNDTLLQTRYLSSRSTRRGRRYQDPDMRVCKSIEELTQMAHDHISTMSPRGMSAYWTLVSKLLNQRSNRPSNQLQMQMKQILAYTLKDITTFGYRDLAQTSISFAKIINKAQKRKRHHYGTTEQIIQDVLIGKGSKIKQFIFTEITKASTPILHEFDARHLSNMIYSFGLVEEVVPVEDGSTYFDMLAEVASPNLHTFNEQDLSNMLWSYANVKVPNSQLFEQAGDSIVVMKNLDKFLPQHLSNTVWAYATAGESHPQLFKRLGDHIIERELNNFKPQELANISWAYATAEESHSNLFKKVADHMVRLDSLNRYASQALKDIVWAYATAEESHSNLFKKVADQIVRLDSLNEFDEQHLSNIVWAFATAKESHPYLFKRIADHIIKLDGSDKFIPQQLSNIVWAYATAKEQHPMMYEKIADHIVGLNNLHNYKSQELKDIVWAFATAGESQPQLFNKLADEGIKRQHEFIPQEISNFLWAHATNGQVDEHLFSSLVPSVKDNLDRFNAQNLANVAWAYSVANVDAPSIFNNEFINACLRKEDSFELEELTQLHQWQLWQDELKSDISLPSSKRCYEAFVSQDPTQSKLQDDVVSILSLMGLQPQEEVLIKSGYRIDAVVEVNGKQIAVEVDGPSHFIGRSRELTGSTILKHRQVAALDGMTVVSIPYWEWDNHENDTEKKKYLQSLLGYETN